jgi:hypothetical protein
MSQTRHTALSRGTCTLKRTPLRKASSKARARAATWRESFRTNAKRYGGRCWRCRVRTATDAHHLRPRSLSFDDSPANIIPLCRPCHDLIERNQDDAVRDGWLAEPERPAKRAKKPRPVQGDSLLFPLEVALVADHSISTRGPRPVALKAPRRRGAASSVKRRSS